MIISSVFSFRSPNFAMCLASRITLSHYYKFCKEFVSQLGQISCQVAAWVPDIFCNFYFVKNHKIANNSATTKAR